MSTNLDKEFDEYFKPKQNLDSAFDSFFGGQQPVQQRLATEELQKVRLDAPVPPVDEARGFNTSGSDISILQGLLHPNQERLSKLQKLIDGGLVGEQIPIEQEGNHLTENLLKGMQKLPLEMAATTILDPVTAAKSTVEFPVHLVDQGQKLASHYLGMKGEPTYQGMPLSQVRGDNKKTYTQTTPDEINQIKKELYERPDVVALAALPFLKKMGGKMFSEAPKIEPSIPKNIVSEKAKPKVEPTPPPEVVGGGKNKPSSPEIDKTRAIFEYAVEKNKTGKIEKISYKGQGKRTPGPSTMVQGAGHPEVTHTTSFVKPKVIRVQGTDMWQITSESMGGPESAVFKNYKEAKKTYDLIDNLYEKNKNGLPISLKVGGERGQAVSTPQPPPKPSEPKKSTNELKKSTVPKDITGKIDVKSKELPNIAPEEQFKRRNVDEYNLTHEEAQILKERVGNKATIGEAVDVQTRMKEAKELQPQIFDIADDIINNRRPHTTAESFALNEKQNQLAKEFDNLTAKIDVAYKNKKSTEKLLVERDLVRSELNKIIEAGEIGGSEAGSALVSRKKVVPYQQEKLGIVLREAELRKEKRLTTIEENKITDAVKQRDQRIKELDAVTEKERANFDKLVEQKAREIIAQQKKRTSSIKKTKDEIADAKKQLAKLGFKVNDISGITTEGLHQVGRLAVGYAKLTGKSLADIVATVKKDIPDLSELQIYEAINTKDPKYIAEQTKNLKSNVRLVKSQAKELVSIDNTIKKINELESKGITPPKGMIDNLQKSFREIRNGLADSGLDAKRLERAVETINRLIDQYHDLYRPVKGRKKPTAPELAELKAKQNELRKLIRAEDRLADLEYQIKTGDIKPKKTIENKPLSPELLKAKTQVKIAEKHLKETVESLKPWTKRRIFREAANTVRTLKATADMSYALRQGLILSISRPKLAGKAFGEAFRAAFSKYRAEQLDTALRSSHEYVIGQNSGLSLAEIGAKLSTGEELFMSSILEKIPGYNKIVQASERNMVTGLNVLRQGTFNEFLRKYPNATSAELKAWADWINVATGRGNLGRAGAVGDILGQVFFAPRFAISRIQTPYMIRKHWSQPRVRKLIAKDMASVAGMAGLTLALAKAGGLDVGTDPRSSDWGKIRTGNTRIDIFAGIQQPMRMLVRMGYFLGDNTTVPFTGGKTITGNDLLESEKQGDFYELLGRFSMYKIAPVISLPVQIIGGKDVIGQEKTIKETALESLLPLVATSIIDAYKEDGAKAAGIAGGLEFFGVGVSAYEDSESAVRRKIRDLQAEGSKQMADEMKKAWNKKHPDKYIGEVKSVEQSTFDSKNRKAEEAFERGDKKKWKELTDELKQKYPEYKDKILTEADLKIKIEDKHFKREDSELKRAASKGQQ